MCPHNAEHSTSFHFTMFGVAVAAVVTLVASSVDSCQTDMDCSLNGQCAATVCRCDPGWRGADCGVLNLGPTQSNTVGSGQIYPALGSNTSSWGGGIVFRDGQYHLYVSEMANHCGLATWGTNSFVRHAVSETVDGMYRPAETVIEAWAHNAMPWVTPDGDIAVWHIGNGNESKPLVSGCTNGTTPAKSGARAQEGLGRRVGTPVPVAAVPYSSNPAGPWRWMNLTCTASDGTNGVCTLDNPTPVTLPNGTTLLAHRAHGFGILAAPHWGGPYREVTDVPPPEDEFSCEDGFLFLGKHGGVHLLCHCNGVQGYPWDDHGRHAYSADGIEWRWSTERTFPPALTHPDGTNTSHISRQRPQLVFGADGAPTHLVSGIAVASTNRPLPWQQGCKSLDAVAKPCDLSATVIQSVLP